MIRPKGVIVDMDGTLCDVRPVLHHVTGEHYDLEAFHRGSFDCPPHPVVVDWVVDKHRDGHAILIVTGRDDWTMDLTRQWLAKHVPVPTYGPWMRTEGDVRANWRVKRDIHRYLSRQWDIREAIDDDPEVIGFWESIGVSTTEVVRDGSKLLHPRRITPVDSRFTG